MTPPAVYNKTTPANSTDDGRIGNAQARPAIDPDHAALEIMRVESSWTPTEGAQFLQPKWSSDSVSSDFALGDPYSAGNAGIQIQTDPVRVAAVFVSIIVVASAAYSLIWGSSL
ncbi:MAG: hypothetical protein HY286_02270 [Planctomycetes bacterium]|nr:hypothetical protein [Planctomycetota bacterium]